MWPTCLERTCQWREEREGPLLGEMDRFCRRSRLDTGSSSMRSVFVSLLLTSSSPCVLHHTSDFSLNGQNSISWEATGAILFFSTKLYFWVLFMVLLLLLLSTNVWISISLDISEFGTWFQGIISPFYVLVLTNLWISISLDISESDPWFHGVISHLELGLPLFHANWSVHPSYLSIPASTLWTESFWRQTKL